MLLRWLLALLLVDHELSEEHGLLKLVLLLSLLKLIVFLNFLEEHHGHLIQPVFQLLVLVL